MKNKRLYFLIATILVVLLDQITKYIVFKTIPVNTIAVSYFGDFFRIIHVRNPGIGFSVGANMPNWIKYITFSIFPMAVIITVLIYSVKTTEINDFQAFWLFVVAGGGCGNIIDRVFRKNGVIDFVDVKFYGIFGLERWPTFNVADMAVVIAMCFLAYSWLLMEYKKKKK